MSVAFKPHSLSVKQVEQAIDGTSKLRANPHPTGTAILVDCYVRRLKPSQAFNLLGVETTDVVAIYVEVSDADSFATQAEITFDGDKYAVVANPELHDAGDVADHAVIYAQKLQYGKP